MTSRERANLIFDRINQGRCAFWTGHPNDETVPIYADAWGIKPSREAIYTYLNDDCRFIPADSGYRHPEGIPLFDPAWGIGERRSLSAEGCFADAESVTDIENYPWPKVEYCDFTPVYKQISEFSDKMGFTGMWSIFFHNATDFFGMENFFIKMYENPLVVEAVIERIVDFYVAASNKFFAGLGDAADVMFFGNDFGTQRDLFIAPELFRKFMLPSVKRLVAVGKKYRKKIMLHSCGSIYRVIPDLIDAGIDALHPLQAQAAGMSAVELAQYKHDLTFVGGIDAQSLLVNATPRQIEAEVERVVDLLGPNIIISPSHEEVLPNVPPGNMLAMSLKAHSVNF